MLYFSVLTLLPIFLIITLPNNWYFVLGKIIVGLWSLGLHNDLMGGEWALLRFGKAKAGFVVNSLLFIIVMFSQHFGIMLLIAAFMVANYAHMYHLIVERQLSLSDEAPLDKTSLEIEQ